MTQTHGDIVSMNEAADRLRLDRASIERYIRAGVLERIATGLSRRSVDRLHRAPKTVLHIWSDEDLAAFLAADEKSDDLREVHDRYLARRLDRPDIDLN